MADTYRPSAWARAPTGRTSAMRLPTPSRPRKRPGSHDDRSAFDTERCTPRSESRPRVARRFRCRHHRTGPSLAALRYEPVRSVQDDERTGCRAPRTACAEASRTSVDRPGPRMPARLRGARGWPSSVQRPGWQHEAQRRTRGGRVATVHPRAVKPPATSRGHDRVRRAGVCGDPVHDRGEVGAFGEDRSSLDHDSP